MASTTQSTAVSFTTEPIATAAFPPLRGRPTECEFSIVVPVHNECEGLDEFLDRLQPVVEALSHRYEIIFVDDGSDDGTLQKLAQVRATDDRIKVLSLSRNFGKDIALSAGLEYAGGSAVIPIDADLQDPPELIASMVEKWHEGYDVVYATRASRKGDSFFKRESARLFYRMINAVSEVPIPADVGDFRLLDRTVVDALIRLPEQSRFMKGLFAWVGFKQGAVFYDRPERALGSTKWNIRRLWKFALDGLTSFSSLPLRVWTYIGVSVSGLAACYALFLIFFKITRGIDVPGYPSLMVVVLFFSGVQLITLGVIGEYLSRVYNEVKKRPLYIVRKALGFDQ